jgi:ribosome-associated translation inhibitor RaiA
MEQQVAEPTVVVRGSVRDDMVDYARDALRPIVAHASVPVLAVQLRLDAHADPARDRPNHVEVTIDLNGAPVRAHLSAPSMTEAIDGTMARLRRRVESMNERPQSRQLRHRDLEAWRRGDVSTERPPIYPRPADDRAVVRRKTFALRAESIEEALSDLELLDHDFFLFVHDETNAPAVVYRTGNGYGLMQRVPTPEAITRVEIPLQDGPPPAIRMLEDALSLLDAAGAPFEFFVDAATGHGSVVYRRYDGNYGLILEN